MAPTCVLRATGSLPGLQNILRAPVFLGPERARQRQAAHPNRASSARGTRTSGVRRSCYTTSMVKDNNTEKILHQEIQWSYLIFHSISRIRPNQDLGSGRAQDIYGYSWLARCMPTPALADSPSRQAPLQEHTRLHTLTRGIHLQSFTDTFAPPNPAHHTPSLLPFRHRASGLAQAAAG